MTDYHVQWSIDITDAADPEAAATQAWELVNDPISTASYFEVSDLQDMTTRVDVMKGTVSEPVWVPSPNAVADLAQWMYEKDWPISEVVQMVRTPHRYADEFSEMIIERAYDAVAKEPEESEPTPDMVLSKMKVHFRPEMWVNDHAVEVQVDWDQDDWNVSDKTAELVRAAIEADGGVDLDFVRHDFFTPHWIADWAGPFTITVVHDDASLCYADSGTDTTTEGP